MVLGYQREYTQYESVTMNGIFDHGLYRSINLADPINNTDATNKQWVINEISTSGGGAPDGNDTEIQFNIGNSFTSSSNLKWVESVFPDGRLELGGGIQLNERDGGSDHVTILAANAMTGSYDIVLPVDAPTVDNQALVSSTSGITSWQTISGGGGGGGIAEVVVDPSGSGDYTTLADAITANETNILLVSGAHSVTTELSIPSYTTITGRKGNDQTIVTFSGAGRFTTAFGGIYGPTAAVTATQGSKTITGVGTTFTSIPITGILHIIINTIWYEIDTIVSDTELTLKDTYQYIDYVGGPQIIIDIHTNINLSNMTFTSTSSTPMSFTGISCLKISNCIFDGFAGLKLSLSTGNYNIIEECIFQNYMDEILLFSGITDSKLRKNTFINNTDTNLPMVSISDQCFNISIEDSKFIQNDIYMIISFHPGAEYIHIINNVFQLNTLVFSAMSISSDHCIINNNRFEQNTKGVVSSGSSHIITNNKFENFDTDTAMTFTGGSDHILDENHFISNLDAIDLNGCSTCTISNNIIKSNTNDGLIIQGNSDRNIIIGNQILSNTGNGVDIPDSTCDNNLISSNVIYLNGTNITDSGTGTVNVNNIIT